TVTEVVITDINTAMMDSLDVTGYLAENCTMVKVILHTMLNTADQLINDFNRGAKGYLVKNVGYNELIFAVTHIARGGRYICEELMMVMMDLLSSNTYVENGHKSKKIDLDLSEREGEVLQLISE